MSTANIRREFFDKLDYKLTTATHKVGGEKIKIEKHNFSCRSHNYLIEKFANKYCILRRKNGNHDFLYLEGSWKVG